MTPLNLVLKTKFQFHLSEGPTIAAIEGADLLGFHADDFLSGRISLLDRIHAHDADLAAEIFSVSSESHKGTVCLRIRDGKGDIRCVEAEYRKAQCRESVALELILRDGRDFWRPPDDGEGMSELRALLERSDDLFVFKDHNHVYTAASASFRRIMSRALDGKEIIGSTDYDLMPESEADSFYRGEKQVLLWGGEVQEVVEVNRPPSGGVRWIHVQQFPVKDHRGTILGVLTIPRDITKSFQHEEELIETKESLQESQALAGVGSYLLDIRRGVLMTSPWLDRIMGIGKEYPHTVEGWRVLIHPEDAAGVLEHLTRDVVTDHKSFNKEYRIIRPSDGAIRWMHGIGRLELDPHGRPLVMRGTVQDITERKETESALRETKNRLTLFIEHAPAALAMFDCEMRFLAVSRRWLELHGLEGQNVIGKSHYAVIANIPDHWKEAHRRGLQGEAQSRREDRIVRADGTTRWSRWEILPWRRDDGNVGGIVIMLEDITEAKEADERLRLAATVLEHASEGIFVTDLQGNILRANEAFTRMTGYSHQEAVGRNPSFLRSDRHDQVFYVGLVQALRESGRWQGEIWNRRKDGTLFAAATTITTVLDLHGEPQYYVALFSDITPIKEQERQLLHIAHFDPLTGLPNRVLLVERLRQRMINARESGQFLAVAYFDLDAFKKINDSHGHAAADRLLVSVAAHMKRTLGEADALARISGDEFVVVSSGLSGPQDVPQVMGRLLRAVSQPVKFGDSVLQASASAGVTLYPQSADVDADQLLRQADKGMYAAKLAGGNRYHLFDPEEDRSARGRLEELGRIRQALRAGEFILHYQPKVNMATGELVGAEALIRWQHPERGLLLPAAFLPVIEEDELAVEVGEWVIETALSQTARWASEGHRLTVCVNVAAMQLQQPDFANRLQQLLDAHPEVDPACLELEVLESSALEDVALVSRVIDACQRMGVSVAIDDFGTGYSTLTYLKHLPANVLKVDQSFVRDMLDDPDDLAILQGVIGLATAFRRVPVAEGVETVGHGVLLLKLGCRIAQGYGIARPMAAEYLLPWHRQWQPDPSWMQCTVVSPSDWPVMVAEVEMRSWLRTLEAYLAGDEADPPELDPDRCRIAAWLETERLGSRGEAPALLQFDRLHRANHEAAQRVVDLKKSGRTAEALVLLAETLPTRKQMHACLKRLVQTPAPEPVRANPRTARSLKVAAQSAKLQ